MVMSWLITTMENEIGQNFMFHGIAKEIQDASKETNSNSNNAVELLDIKRRLHDLQQGDLSITQYYNILTRFQQQLDVFEDLSQDYLGDATKYEKIVEKDRVSKFLLELYKNLDDVRGECLG